MSIEVTNTEVNLSSSSPSWREEDGVIYFSVTSDGTTGKDWMRRLADKGFNISIGAKQVLDSSYFYPSKGVTTEVAVLKGMLFEDCDRTKLKIRIEAIRRKFLQPNPEVACLIREKFTDDEVEAMGLEYIVVMHYPIKDYCGDICLMCLDGSSENGPFLSAYPYMPDEEPQSRDEGFAFAVVEVSS